jgi:RTX calcium-binding nonapeptide repeat (4 copies)
VDRTTSSTVTTVSTSSPGETPPGGRRRTTTTQHFSFSATIKYTNAGRLEIKGSPVGAGTHFDVRSTVAGTNTVLDVASTNAMVNAGAGNLDSLAGPVTVNGSGAGTVVNLNDQSAPTADTDILGSSTFTRSGSVLLTYGGVGSLHVSAAPNADSTHPEIIAVLGTPSGTITTIDASNGFHNIFVGLPAGNSLGVPGAPLDNMQGPVTVIGQGFQDNLDLYDLASSSPRSYNLNATSISASPDSNGTPGLVSWQGNLSTVVVFGSAAADTYTLQSAPTDLADIIAVGAPTTNTCQSNLPDRHTWLIFPNEVIETALQPGEFAAFENAWNFTGGPAGDDFQFTPGGGRDGLLNGVLNGNGGTLDYSQDSSPVTVNLATRSATNLDGGLAGGFSNIRSVIGNNTNTTVVGPDSANFWNITGPNQGNLAQAPNQTGGFTFSRVPNLTGGAAADTFAFQPGGSVSGILDGGSGPNTLDYSQYTGDVTVDLALNLASLVGQGAPGRALHVANVTGSRGNDLLVGDANANVLIGGTGRNVLIGGDGADTIDASRATGDNILIGGRTDFDIWLAALNALFAEWTRTDLGFRDRYSDLTNGSNSTGAPPRNVLNGRLILLTPATDPTSSNGSVHSDASPNTLIGSTLIDSATGNRVHNWFFFDDIDTIMNFQPSSDHRTRVR